MEGVVDGGLPDGVLGDIEQRIREAVRMALGEQQVECATQAIASISLQLRTMSALATLFPMMTSSQHVDALMKKYTSSCLQAIQNESRAILQVQYPEGGSLTCIPENKTLNEVASPIRSHSPDLKVPKLRAKSSPRRQLLQPKTRRSLQLARRKSCDLDSAKALALSVSSIPGAVFPEREPTLQTQSPPSLKKAPMQPPSTMPPKSATSRLRFPTSGRRPATSSAGRSPGRRSSDLGRFDAEMDVSRSMDWNNLGDRLSNEEGSQKPTRIKQRQVVTRQVSSATLTPKPFGTVKKPKSIRSLGSSPMPSSDVERQHQQPHRRSMEFRSRYPSTDDKRESVSATFIQNIEELVAKSSPYDEVFATRARIHNDDDWP
ncbi:unnamed protein product (mitochondrion) [Plasmodiophora brassicae]|uniref:Uncharacterized protein n=1 Tax=Plasmodiophora brassicae TaxID=37360 RepID=A0A3P3Y8P9_PLABS|nr:unnamed protein product [Plasmodiophora brassicae]